MFVILSNLPSIYLSIKIRENIDKMMEAIPYDLNNDQKVVQNWVDRKPAMAITAVADKSLVLDRPIFGLFSFFFVVLFVVLFVVCTSFIGTLLFISLPILQFY